MANCYVCPECGEYLDWTEAARHKCEPRTVKVVNEKLAKSEPEVKRATPAEIDSVMAQIRRLLN
ncbi:MAG: hypothetical protein IJG23_06110 [Clostridia bacterium]|nr:hypothetical protein [Clostridia bacterium]